MNPSSNQPTAAQRLSASAIPVAIALVLLNAAWAAQIRHSTGIIAIQGPDANATISISQDNKAAQVIGIGSTTVRLRPGQYELAARSTGYTSTAYVRVRAGSNTPLHLVKTVSAPLASAENITFTGMEALTNMGVADTQTTALKTLFFDYQHAAKTVNIDASNITNGPHEPDTNQPFTLNFTGTIDGVAYRATIAYVGTDDMRLTIYNPQTGAQLFDKSA